MKNGGREGESVGMSQRLCGEVDGDGRKGGQEWRRRWEGGQGWEGEGEG